MLVCVSLQEVFAVPFIFGMDLHSVCISDVIKKKKDQNIFRKNIKSKTWFLKRAWPASAQECPEERKWSLREHRLLHFCQIVVLLKFIFRGFTQTSIPPSVVEKMMVFNIAVAWPSYHFYVHNYFDFLRQLILHFSAICFWHLRWVQMNGKVFIFSFPLQGIGLV